MKTKLIKTDLYLLLIDEESRGMEFGEIGVNMMHSKLEVETRNIGGYGSDNYYLSHKKCLAYYPLNSEAKELDLPLLPNPFEEEPLMKQASKLRELRGYHKDNHYSFCGGFIEGYKAAQSRQYSLEDVKKAIKMAKGLDIKSGVWYKCDAFSEEEIIQSLSTQRLPVGFEPEYEEVASAKWGYGAPCDYKLKTITNSNGKEELVGVYKC